MATKALKRVLWPALVCFWTGIILRTSSFKAGPIKKSMISNSWCEIILYYAFVCDKVAKITHQMLKIVINVRSLFLSCTKSILHAYFDWHENSKHWLYLPHTYCNLLVENVFNFKRAITFISHEIQCRCQRLINLAYEFVIVHLKRLKYRPFIRKKNNA